MAISNHTEQFIIEALRVAKALTLSIVAEVDGRVIGHIAFSTLTISDHTRDWYGLGPVSVRPEYQRRGIGGALISTGLSRLKTSGGAGCCLVGHTAYYRRFGFENARQRVCEGVPREFLFVLSNGAHLPQGTVEFHGAFKADDPQSAAGDAQPPHRRGCQLRRGGDVSRHRSTRTGERMPECTTEGWFARSHSFRVASGLSDRRGKSGFNGADVDSVLQEPRRGRVPVQVPRRAPERAMACLMAWMNRRGEKGFRKSSTAAVCTPWRRIVSSV